MTDKLSGYQIQEFENEDKQIENNIINLGGRILKVFKNRNAKKQPVYLVINKNQRNCLVRLDFNINGWFEYNIDTGFQDLFYIIGENKQQISDDEI